MIKPNKQEIKKLLKIGFDPQLIALEFGIPIKQINLIKKELEQSRISRETVTSNKQTSKKRDTLRIHDRFEIMRNKYKKLYFDIDEEDYETKRRKIPQEEREKIDQTIEKIEEILDSITEETTDTYKKNKNSAYVILQEIEKLGKYQFSIKQSEKIIRVLQSPKMQNIKLKSYEEKKKYTTILNRVKKDISKKYIQSIEIVLNETNEIEELKELRKKISFIPFDLNKATAENIKSRINLKIQRDPQQMILNKIKNDIPENILALVQDLSNGKLDIQSARKIIKEEAKRRVESKPKNRFTLTEEQEINQILFQIKVALEERIEDYKIVNPEITVLQLHNLCKDNLHQSLSTVIENLINSKSFETAKNLFEKFSASFSNAEDLENLRITRNRIRNAEIGDLVLRGITTNRSIEEETNYFELIEKGLKTSFVKKTAIVIGKSQSGIRTITLEDIWPEEQRERFFEI